MRFDRPNESFEFDRLNLLFGIHVVQMIVHVNGSVSAATHKLIELHFSRGNNSSVRNINCYDNGLN